MVPLWIRLIYVSAARLSEVSRDDESKTGFQGVKATMLCAPTIESADLFPSYRPLQASSVVSAARVPQ